MLNEGFKSKIIYSNAETFSVQKEQQTPPGSMVAGSWAHLPQSDAERQCWDVFRHKQSSWLPSRTSCVTASTELSCCYLEPIAKLQQMQLKYTKLVLLCRSAWCNHPRGAAQYWSAMKQPLCWGVGCTAGFGATALHETFSTGSLFHFHTKASCQEGEDKLLFATQGRAVDKKKTPFSKAGGGVPLGSLQTQDLCTLSFPTKGLSRLSCDHSFSGEQEIFAIYRLRSSHLQHQRLQSAVLLLGRCCGSSQADIVP